MIGMAGDLALITARHTRAAPAAFRQCSIFQALLHSFGKGALSSGLSKPLLGPSAAARPTDRTDFAVVLRSNAYFPCASPDAASFQLGSLSSASLLAV